MTETRQVLYQKEGDIATITINRPEAMNAFSPEVIHQAIKYLEEAGDDPEVRVIVFTGAGEKAFSAGADIKQMKGMTALKARQLSQLGETICLALENNDKPVIAAMNGYALGGGLEVAMSCDFRIAHENVRMGQTEVNIGLIPGWGGTQRLTRLIGATRAKEMVYTGKMIDARTAEQIGLINMAVPIDKFKETIKEFATELAQKAPIAIRIAKSLINKGTETSLDVALELEREGFGVVASTEDLQEGVQAFSEKRKPVFRGK